uniref:Reverse transcriptase zinc-binding domain-containing protein n=1 Tax=Arundo donax TaxID=35708 RepID=A0A0A9DU72_ARUDO
MPVHTPAIWSSKIPSRVHIFLWLLTKNKILTRDNLSKCRNVEDSSCLFCSEQESIHHLFFDCATAKVMWYEISVLLSLQIGENFESVGSKWLCNKRFMVVNIVSSAALWSLWKLRNDLCFQRSVWKDMSKLWSRVWDMINNWKLLCPLSNLPSLEQVAEGLKDFISRPGRIQWKESASRLLG